ncbi:hypothetical protein BD779DRAFT_1542162 [Infundibulicybe gibba]|nr:hypothetical protein BD779DRAFT_1542162 [Infundibulicybe gibba]
MVNDFSLPSHSFGLDSQTLSPGTRVTIIPDTRVEMILFHAGVVLVDIIITVSINSFILSPNVLEKLIMYTVARGLLLTGVQPADAISWFPSQVLLSNICVVTLPLFSLNARTTFREMFEASALPTFSLRFAESPNSTELPGTRVNLYIR